MKLVNIRNDDIADGNPKLTLGLIWTIILHFQVRPRRRGRGRGGHAVAVAVAAPVPPIRSPRGATVGLRRLRRRRRGGQTAASVAGAGGGFGVTAFPPCRRRQISDIQVTGQSEDMTAKEKLLLWSQRMVEDYQGLRCDNFTTSWRDGRLFNAIIHRHK